MNHQSHVRGAAWAGLLLAAGCTATPSETHTPPSSANIAGLFVNGVGLGFGACSKLRVAVTVGFNHSCALLSDGTAECWGANSNGELGAGFVTSASPFDVPSPVPVASLSGITAIDAGDYHTCAISSGNVYCWGTNSNGELGTGNTQSTATPIEVAGLAGVTAVGGGFDFTCALLGDGSVQCWGANDRGQLGNGNGQQSTTPVAVFGLTGATALSVGGEHACVLMADGSARCWGDNTSGQLGDTAQELRSVPFTVPGLTGLQEISAGIDHTCAVTGGLVQCWGGNAGGELGNGTTTPSTSPVSVSGPTGVVDVVAAEGAENTCAIDGNGALWCWGDNTFGELGFGPGVLSTLVPNLVSGLGAGVVGVANGFTHTCANTKNGSLDCSGIDTVGQLGIGGSTTTEATTPVPVPGGGVSPAGQTCRPSVGACDLTEQCDGVSASCPADVLVAVGTVCRGTLGSCAGAATCTGTTGICPANTIPDGGAACTTCSETAQAITAGSLHACALLGGGQIECWGDNKSGQLGNGTTDNSSTPVIVPNISGALAVAAGGSSTCAILADRTVACWGANENGELGNGTTNGSPSPVPVTGLTNVSALAAGFAHMCALHVDGTIDCWGHGSLGELGGGSTITCPPCGSSVPVRVNIGPATSIAAGTYFTCAVVGGSVSCWGDNSNGVLGASTPVSSGTPTTVPNLTGVTAIAAGTDHVCALGPVQDIFCWGSNGEGQLGNGNTIDSPTPVLVASLEGIGVSLAAGASFTCAGIPHQVACWGWNGWGQLGASTAALQQSSVPFFVPGTMDNIGRAPTVVAAGQFACALLGSGEMWCWGDDRFGQDGNQTSGLSSLPGQVVCPAVVGNRDGGVDAAAGAGGSAGGPGGGSAGAGGSGAPVGHSCSSATDCASGFCSDGVCCGTDCGNDPKDCQACSVTAGSATDGTCALLGPNTICRPSAGACDVAESCTGTLPGCPLDQFQAANTICAPSPNVCETAGVCSGTNAVCPLIEVISGCGGFVQGTVTWGGAPVTGSAATNLLIFGSGTTEGWNGVPDPVTGRYQSGLVFPDDYAVSITSAGLGPIASADAPVSLGATTEVDFDLTQEAGLLEGFVPIGEAASIFIQDGNGDGATIATDDSGQFAILLPPGSYTATYDSARENPFLSGTFAFDAVAGQATNPGSPGAPCPVGNECDPFGLSCVDGVCCTTACGGGNPNDCQACSVAAGGSTDGTCTPLTRAQICRPSAGACDVAESCTTSSLDCPADVLVAAGTVCSGAASDLCEVAGTCSGGGADCPAPTTLPTTECTSISLPRSPGTPIDFLGGDTKPGGVTITFQGPFSVDASILEIKVVTTTAGPPPPPGFEIASQETFDGGSHDIYWMIDATPGYDAPRVCIGVDPKWGNVCNLALDHDAGSGFGPVTTIRCDSTGHLCCTGSSCPVPPAPCPVPANVICGSTASFSPFTIVTPTATPPIIGVPSNMIVEARGPTGANLTYVASANDPQDGPLTPSCTPASGTTFPLGTTSVTCTATDNEGLSSSGSFTVTVVDTTPPVWTHVPATIVAYATSIKGAKVTYIAPTATDAVDGVRPVTCMPASGSTFPVNKTTVTCSASDKSGHSSQVTFTVWVQYQAPTDGSFFLLPLLANGKAVFPIGPLPLPVVFKLTGASASISNLTATFSATKTSSSVAGTTAISGTTGTSPSAGTTFNYLSPLKLYDYLWRVSNQTQGTYQIGVNLGDGVSHQLNVSLKALK
jgi:alpha-tubulin suppressor-like RCC1 family protein